MKSMIYLEAIRSRVAHLANPSKAAQTKRFFKTGEGQYGEGDTFVGLTMPECRQIAKGHSQVSLGEIEALLQSKIHEERVIALVCMINCFKSGTHLDREEVFKLYVRRMEFVNNWDLVDISAPHIVGDYLLEREKTLSQKNEQ